MDNLPSEITAHIFSRLPMVSRLQCREVCTTWRDLLPKPKMGLLYTKAAEDVAEFYFAEQNNDKIVSTNHVDDAEQQINYHSLIMPAVSSYFKSIGSCNGLVCYGSFSNSATNVYICNPVTGEQIQLPISNKCGDDYFLDQAIGFGYSLSSCKYKVVRILRNHSSLFDAHNRRRQTARVQVCTIPQGGSDWKIKNRKIEKCFVSFMGCESPLAGVTAGGALHWIFRYSSMEQKIVAFDLEQEKFKFLPSIPSVGHDTNNDVELMLLGGTLCVLEVVLSKHVTIWESSKYTRKSRRCVSTWVRKFSIAWEDYNWLEPFALPETDTCLLWYNAVLSCYDPETKTPRKLDETLKKLKDGFTTSSVYATSRATPHVNSLVSLKAIMEERVGKKRKAHELGNTERKDFYKVSPLMYKKRKEVLLENLKLGLSKLENQIRFIDGVAKGEIEVFFRSMRDIVVGLRERGFIPQFPKMIGTIEDEESVEDVEQSADYGYLLSMLRIGGLSQEQFQDLRDKKERLEAEVEVLTHASPESFVDARFTWARVCVGC